jgi:hypothetical protein
MDLFDDLLRKHAAAAYASRLVDAKAAAGL